MKKGCLFLFTLALVGCNQRVVTYLNPKSNFGSFESYRVVSPKLDNSKLNKESNLVYDLIKEGIALEMAKRNYEKSTVSPDLTLRYELTSSTRVQTSTNQSPFSPFYQVNSRTIHEAVLLLELYNEQKKLVWQGSYDLQQERKEKRVRKVIENAIGRIFTTYPYKALQKEPDPTLSKFEKRKTK